MTAARKRHAEIAGAGIAGLTAGAALARRGWSVVVHERSTTLRAEGAGIYIWENGLRVLTALGAYDDATRGSHHGVMRETRDDGNRVVAVARWSAEPGRRVMSIARIQLLAALAEAARRAGAEIRFGSEMLCADPSGAAILADGQTVSADLVVGADGIESKIRSGLDLDCRRVPLADGAIRTMIKRTDEERRSPDGQNYVEYWSGTRRVLYTPCSGDAVYLALTALDADAEAKAVPVRKDVWKRSFPHIAALIDRIDGPARWDRFENVSLRPWSKGRVAILGDAAHAQAPNLGQGGGCALMNALALAVALDERPTVGEALALWETRERPLTDHTQRISALYSRVTTLPPLLRAAVLWLAGRSRWAMEQRLRTALHVPTGTC